MTERRTADRYHHGDLRNALIDAATAVAREGGPDALALREVARRVGVSAAAAYHHFAGHEEIVEAVKRRALSVLTGEMRLALQENPENVGPRAASGEADAARGRLRALGAAYLRFAFNEPGLFRLAFGPRGHWPAAETPGPGDEAADDPFALLADALDATVAAGVVPAERRPGLEYVLWAAVHGIAVLCLDGPLARLTPAERGQMADRVLDTAIRGL
ncbi:MAG TPA: TetR/AcrR family transcriptional regulator [Streptosporangiaceae bacterium]|nr:TetR/AcrR family transcriptional regulator [Streptosporangiaceae bacterium]